MNSPTGGVWVVALCVVAVVVGGLMFPATGLGSVPSGPVGGEGADDAGGAGSGEPGPVGTPEPATTHAPTDRSTNPGDTTSEPLRNGSAGDATVATPTSTAAETRTASPTPTATATATSGAGGDEGAAAVAAWLARGALVVAALLGFLGTCEAKARRWPLFRRLPVPAVTVTGLGRAAAQLSMHLVVRVSASVPGLLSGLGSATRAGVHGLAFAVGAIGRGLAALAVAGPRAIGGALTAASGGLVRIVGGVSRADRTVDASGTSDSRPVATPSTESPDEPPETVAGAWLAMVERIPVRQRETKTPAELARIAVDRGFPSEAVHQLTEAFRRVAYGGVAATEQRTAAALRALGRIERWLEDDE